MTAPPTPSLEVTRDWARRALEMGYEIRQRTELAPFFGPRAEATVESKAWAEIDRLRRELEEVLHALCPDKPSLWPMFKLEAAGCGENYHRGVENLLVQGADEAQVRASLEAELGVFLSRIAALRGDGDPDHGVL